MRAAWPLKFHKQWDIIVFGLNSAAWAAVYGLELLELSTDKRRVEPACEWDKPREE